jgi:Flp pilus assembly protein TadD
MQTFPNGIFLAAIALIAVSLGGCATTQQSESVAESESVNQPAAEVDQLVAIGDRAWRQGAPDTALLQYMQALDSDPENLSVLFRVAEVHARETRPAQALPYYEQMLVVEPGQVDALEGAGLALIEMRRPGEARARLQQAVTQDPRRWRSRNGLGIIADLEADYAQATLHYSEALVVNPGSAMLSNNLGYSRYMAGDLLGAEEAFLDAVAFDPAFERAWRNLGLLRVKQSRYAEALDIFLRSEEAHEAHNTVGYLCFLNGRYAEAEHFLRRAAELSPTYYDRAYENLARVDAARHASAIQASAPSSPQGAADHPADAADDGTGSARVTASRLRLSVDGNTTSEPVGVLAHGDRVEILARAGNWALVQTSLDGGNTTVRGWAQSWGLETIR